MASIFDKLLKASDSQFGSLVEDNNDADVVSYIDTGSYSLNAILSGDIFGGLPSNKVSAIAGDPSTGKTFFAIHIIKGFLDANPEAAVYYFESETAVTTDMLEDAGIDTSRFFIMPVGTVEEFRTQCVKILDAYLEIKPEDRPPMFMALDSLGMLSTNKETSDIATGSDKRDMTKAPLIKGAFRVITMKLGRAKVPLLVTNHLYNVIGCGTKDMMVQTNFGVKSIAEIDLNDIVIQNKNTTGKVTQKHAYVTDQTYFIELSDGTSVRVTGDHKFMVQGDWVKVEDLYARWHSDKVDFLTTVHD